MAVAAVHGTVPPPAPTLQAEAEALYAAPLANLRAAFLKFNASFGAEVFCFRVAALFSVGGF